MAITELPWGIRVAEGQGLIGTRQWALDANDDAEAFLAIVSDSHFYGYPDALPVDIQVGPFIEGIELQRYLDADNLGLRTRETLGARPLMAKYRVAVTYALQRMQNCWPTTVPKPWHPDGTTLSLRIHGAAQILSIVPHGVTAPSPLVACGAAGQALQTSRGTRIVIGTPEYHLSCDRMTAEQVDTAMTGRHWDNCVSCVNETEDIEFLGKPAGTLLFESYTLTETQIAHSVSPLRYCLTAVLKYRSILDENAEPKYDSDGRAIGWNHDYVALGDYKNWDWRYIKIAEGIDENNAPRCRPRYPSFVFSALFGASHQLTECDPAETPGTILRDSDICWVDPIPPE